MGGWAEEYCPVGSLLANGSLLQNVVNTRRAEVLKNRPFFIEAPAPESRLNSLLSARETL